MYRPPSFVETTMSQLNTNINVNTDLSVLAKQKNIKFFMVSFVDLFGILRAKLVPAGAIKGIQKDGK